MTENQHWVPKFLIKQFVHKGRVYRLDIHTDEVSWPPPKFAASEEGFNDFIIDGETVSFEDRLEKIETATAPVIKRIVENKTLSGLNLDDRRRLAEFVAVQSIRTKAFYEGMADKSAREAFGATFQSIWDSIFITAGMIAARPWALLVIPGDDVFYLGDNPIILQWTETPGAGGSLGFDVDGVEAYLPLSPKCALYMPCRSAGRRIIEAHESALALHRAVRSAIFLGHAGGSEELATAQTQIRKSYELYSAFTTGSPVVTVPENIESFNSLQCLFAHSAIFSNKKDFTFARHVFKNTPSYRALQKTSLLKGTILVPEERA